MKLRLWATEQDIENICADAGYGSSDSDSSDSSDPFERLEDRLEEKTKQLGCLKNTLEAVRQFQRDYIRQQKRVRQYHKLRHLSEDLEETVKQIANDMEKQIDHDLEETEEMI